MLILLAAARLAVTSCISSLSPSRAFAGGLQQSLAGSVTTKRPPIGHVRQTPPQKTLAWSSARHMRKILQLKPQEPGDLARFR